MKEKKSDKCEKEDIDYIEEYGSEKLKFKKNSPKFKLKSDAEYEKENKTCR